MKKAIFTLLLLFIFLGMRAQVEFKLITSEEEMEGVWMEASKQHKSVFVDIYATWCGPCKWLDANVFALELAGNYMNKEFINVKMDGESEFGRVFAMESGLSAYPSLFIFNSERKMMNVLVGAKPWEELEPALASTLEFFPILEVLQSKYESDILKKEEYPRYVKALRAMGKDDYANDVAGRYKEKHMKEGQLSEEDIQVIAYSTEPGSENWGLLTSDIPQLKEAMGVDLEGFIDHSVSRSIELAVEEGEDSKISGLARILPQLCKGTGLDPVELESRAYIYFYHYSDMIDEMVNYVDNEYSSKHEGDYKWLFEAAASAVFLDPQNTEVAEKGLKWFQTCIDQKETQEFYYHLALCQYFTDSPEKAIASLNKSLEFTDDQETRESTLSIIGQIEGELAGE